MKAKKMNVYSPRDADIDNVVLNRADEKGNVILVSPREATHLVNQNLYRLLRERGRLNRVVIDEAHLILTSQHYRPEMQSVGVVSNWGEDCRTVLLSATVPPTMVDDLTRVCGIAQYVRVVRGDPRRRNLRLCVKDYGQHNVDRLLKVLARRTASLHKKERCIVYCLRIAEIDKYYNLLKEMEELRTSRFLKYHGEMTNEEHRLGLSGWNETPPEDGATFMLATEAFGCGIDVPNVRQVVMVGGAPSVLDFWQQAGRAGRDGRPAAVTVIYAKERMRHGSVALGDVYHLQRRCGNMTDYVTAKPKECRRVKVEELLGGRDANWPKKCTESELKCNNCETNWQTNVGHQNMPESPETRRSLPVAVVPEEEHNAAYEAEARKRNAREVRMWEIGFEYLGKTSAFLEGLCVYCLLRKSGTEEYRKADESTLRAWLEEARRCQWGHCYRNGEGRVIKTCHRCKQSDHEHSKSCLYLESRYDPEMKKKKKPFRCGGCRTNTIGGRYLHNATNAGPTCKYRHATMFCFIAYDVFGTRRTIMKAGSPYMISVSKKVFESPHATRARYIEWLTEDGRPRDDAGLLAMVQYLFAELNLEKLKEL